MKIGFIELENQIEASSELVQKQITESNKRTVKALSDFSQKVEKGFLAVESALDKDLNDIKSEIKGIKKRLDQGNL